MTFYRRRLPHWQPAGAAIFLTWHLFGTEPSLAARKRRIVNGADFVAWDRELDATITGPRWLAEPGIARIVVRSIHFCEDQLALFGLMAYVLMPNHVHILLQPYVAIAVIMQKLKGFTSRKANALLHRQGTPFWQDESFDHRARTADEARKIIRYTEWNPVRAGLVATPEDWPWSSAGERRGTQPLA